VEPSFNVLIFAPLAAVAALLGYALFDAWRRVLRDSTPLPLFDVLRREGLSPGEAQDALGAEALAYATRRCTLCATGNDCSARLAAGDCPNAGLFAELRQPRL
jgi:hypothetical protein